MIDCLGSRAAVLLCFAALVAASACVQTNTASDGALDGAWAGDHDGDAGLLDDAPLTQDARVTDALGPDAHSEDVWRAEVCNGVDDDGDFRIDESTTSCTEAPHGVAAVCVEGGVCVCRPPALPTHAGTYEDCNADWSDGCETALDTEANCGACGVSCDVVSRCVDGAGGVSCRPVGIRDFSVAEPMGQITCIVTADEQLICRGPNTDFAISDAEPDTAVLDWTRVEVERPMWVRTWSRTRADGATVLLICTRHWATSDEGVGSGIVCRGDSESPFHRRYSPSARRGNVRVEDGVDIAVWRDEGRCRSDPDVPASWNSGSSRWLMAA